MRKQTRRILVAFALFGLLTVGVSVLKFIILRGRTPGIDSPRAIAALEKQRIGGVDQWILVRGHDRTRPVILFLHGGPGMPAMFLAHAFQRELEKDFVVVHWDRRGAGKSFDAAMQSPALSISQTLSDTFELTRSLQTRFGHPRIYLVAHSWGTYLGLLAVREHPEYYAAFIGMGQLAGTREEVCTLRHELLRAAAAKMKDSELEAKAADRSTEITEEDLFDAGGELYRSRSFFPILWTGLAAPEYTLRDALNVKKGAELVSREMKHDVFPRPLDGEVAKVDIPVFFFLGRHDLNTPSQIAAEYLNRLDAPLKDLVWFEQSAHFPFFEEPAVFHAEMVRAMLATAEFWKSKGSTGVISSQLAGRAVIIVSADVPV